MKNNGDLKTIGSIADSLGIEALRKMGFNIPKTSLEPRQALNMMERWKKWKPPYESDIANVDDIEMQYILKIHQEELRIQLRK